MGFFLSLFKQKNEVEQQSTDTERDLNTLPEISQEDFVDNSDPDDSNLVRIQYGTLLPIDVIYSFINRDNEELGYDDAMCNADCSYKKSKKDIIKNELKRLFEQVGLRYKSDLRDIEVQIDIVEQQGLINTALALKARKETFIEHMAVIKEMEISLEDEKPQMLSMIDSYERGFLKGLAAKSGDLLRK